MKPAELAAQLQAIHAVCGVMLQSPELQLADAEAKSLAEALAKVGEHYNLTMDPKTGAIVGLVATAAMIYVPRAFMISARLRAAKPRPSGANPTAHVVQFPTGEAVQPAATMATAEPTAEGFRLNNPEAMSQPPVMTGTPIAPVPEVPMAVG